MAYSVYEDALKSGQSTYRPISAGTNISPKHSENVLPIKKIQYQESPGASSYAGSAIGETLRKGILGGVGLFKSLFHAPIEAATTIQRMMNTPTINPLLIKRADEITAATKSLNKDDPNYSKNIETIKAASAQLQKDVEKQTSPLINTSPEKFLGQIGETALMALPAGELNAVRGSTLFGKGVSTAERLKSALPLAARGAGIGAGFGVTQTMQEDQPNIKSLAKNVGINAAIGAGAELAAPLLFKRLGGKQEVESMAINPPIDSRVRNQFQKNLTAQLEAKNPEAAKIIADTNFDDAISSVDLARKAFDSLPDNLRQDDAVKQAIHSWAKSGEQTLGFIDDGVDGSGISKLSKDLLTTKSPQTTNVQMGSTLQRIFSEKSFQPDFLQGMKSREARTVLDTVATKSEKLRSIEAEIQDLTKQKLNARLQTPEVLPEKLMSGLKLNVKTDPSFIKKQNQLETLRAEIQDITKNGGDDLDTAQLKVLDKKQAQFKTLEQQVATLQPTSIKTKGETLYAKPKSYLKVIESQKPRESSTVNKLDKLIEYRTQLADELRGHIDELKNSTSYKNMVKAKELKIPEFQDTISTRNVIVDPENAIALSKVQDLKPRETGYLTTIDPIRAAEKGDRSLRGIVKRIFVEPVMVARDKQMTELQQVKKVFDTLADEAGVKPVKGLGKMLGLQREREARNALIFRAAEGRAEVDIKKLTNPEQRLITYTRGKYDELLDRLNAVRAKVNLKPIAKRKDYITHIQTLSFLESMGKDASKMSDSEISQFIQKKSSPFQFAKERKGGAFEEDLTKAFNAYLEPALRQIHFTEAGNSILAHAKFLPPNQKRYWEDFVRERVFGSMDDLSSYANKVIHPSFSRMTQELRRITGRGAILGNIQTIALQPSSIAQVYGTAGGRALLRSTPKMLSSEGTAFVERFSPLYRMRAQELDINPNTMTKAQNVLNYANKELDHFMVKTAWLSSYEQATRQFGLNHSAAVRYAENMAGKTQAIYDKMFASRMAGSKVGGVLAQFQTYSFNLWNQLTRDLNVTSKTFNSKKVALKQAMKIGIGMFAVNQLYKGAGLQSPFDVPSFDSKNYSKERKKGTGIIPSAIHSTSAGTILPYSGTAKYGAPIAIDLLYNLFKLPIVMNDAAERSKTMNELGKTIPMLIPAGNQIRKTTEGLQAVIDGHTKVGTKKIPIKGTTEEIRAILFGKYGTKAARDYFNNK